MSDEITPLLAYVESAVLAPIGPGLHTRAACLTAAGLQENSVALSEAGDRGKYFGEPGSDGAAAIGGTLVSVLANLTGQNRVNGRSNSLEFASRVAAKEAGSDDHTSKYWEEFKTSLFQIGWLKQKDEWSKDFVDGQTSGAENFSDYVITNVRDDPLYSEAEKSVVTRAMKSLRSQAAKRAFFRRFTAGGSKGSFGVNAATVNNGALALRFSVFTFKCNAAVDDYLIFNIKHIKADVQKDNVDVAGNQRTIDGLRSKIEAKLDKAASDYIDDVDI
ncbi:32 kDa-cell wall symbiosis regulated acidic polypeptide [Pisolithus croceorrhizus]|nr:32 kDa-cell wall symbiosis regulated acidic polypeptide [Pisolithus croceorrhizus]KAI6158485.1 32 kDa-cell wall symbiosis regulated acidic polypeptide [Pisolithus thermaeus]